jgi:hypothetical protein
MYYLVNVDHNGMAVDNPRVTVKGFNYCCMPNAVDGTNDDVVWNDSEEDRNVRSECVADKGTEHEDGDSDNGW